MVPSWKQLLSRCLSIFPLLVIVHALAIQVLTGLWMGWIYLPGLRGLFTPANPIGMLVGVKLLLFAGSAALAVHARLRLIPNLSVDSLSDLAWHIRGITALAIAFVVVGGLIRLGAFRT